jgi:O-methyltransferase
MPRFLMKLYYLLTIPVSIFFILHSERIHPAYKLSWRKRITLALRIVRNKHRIPTGTSYKTSLVMALKLFELDPAIPGVVIECGTWKGGNAANLSLCCELVGRKLLIFDSYQGLPPGDPLDREAPAYKIGDYCGTIDEVRSNISRYGSLGACELIPGWFCDTLPKLHQPVVLAFLDVDLEASLDTCVRNIWPRLRPEGYMFIDEYVGPDYCALFYSERYWKENFDRTPPGLIGAGSGLALGEYYIGPWNEKGQHPAQHATGAAYTRKCMSGYWSFYPASLTGPCTAAQNQACVAVAPKKTAEHEAVELLDTTMATASVVDLSHSDA